MPKIDACALEVLNDYEEGKLVSVATKSELAVLKEAARATAIKDRPARGAKRARSRGPKSSSAS
ncbi:MAG TPA: hypothetical protein VEW48_02140 [Thermoanaerobaculia bacterium]|nr:hypothetical protein [Thermoanaerobaculia bacterium]